MKKLELHTCYNCNIEEEPAGYMLELHGRTAHAEPLCVGCYVRLVVSCPQCGQDGWTREAISRDGCPACRDGVFVPAAYRPH